jgi:mono/diheme cytochrome c family protein
LTRISLLLAFAFAARGYVSGGEIGTGAAADNSDKGKELFVTWGCGNCHVLADAGAAGQVGPSLDGNPYLTGALVVNRIAYGQAGMPAFGGQLSEEDIADIAAYIIRVAAK